VLPARTSGSDVAAWSNIIVIWPAIMSCMAGAAPR